MDEITNCIRIQSNEKLKINPDGDFFRVWVDFLRPIHDLTKKEMDILALYLKERYLLSKTIFDTDTLDRVLMSNEIRKKVREQCGIKPRHLNVILSTFRKRGVIKDNKFSLSLIPKFTDEGAGLMIFFNFKDEQKRIKLGPPPSRKRA
jgi:hypothetical protein